MDQNNENNNVIENKRLLNDEKYYMLQQCQKSIYQATESTPTIRKIINELITEENLQKIITKFIEVWE
jgi:hypothetical protein